MRVGHVSLYSYNKETNWIQVIKMTKSIEKKIQMRQCPSTRPITFQQPQQQDKTQHVQLCPNKIVNCIISLPLVSHLETVIHVYGWMLFLPTTTTYTCRGIQEGGSQQIESLNKANVVTIMTSEKLELTSRFGASNVNFISNRIDVAFDSAPCRAFNHSPI